MDGCKPNSIDYYTYENEMVRAERHSHRWMTACIILFVALFLTNIGWFVYVSQFEEVTTVEQDVDTGDSGETVISGVGDINYGTNQTDSN